MIDRLVKDCPLLIAHVQGASYTCLFLPIAVTCHLMNDLGSTSNCRFHMSIETVHTCRTWIKYINDQSLDGLFALASIDHTFFVEGEQPTIGRDKVRPSWAGYFTGFPDYVVFEDELFDLDDAVYVVGHTTGSHVSQKLETIPSSVIWKCVVNSDGNVSEWSVYPATPENRSRFQLV